MQVNVFLVLVMVCSDCSIYKGSGGYTGCWYRGSRDFLPVGEVAHDCADSVLDSVN